MAEALGKSSSCADVRRALNTDSSTLSDISIVLTGATAGLGMQLAFELASLGATLVCGVRSEEKGAALVSAALDQGITSTPEWGLGVQTLPLDLSSQTSVRQFATSVEQRVSAGDLPPLRQLVLNAGRLSMNHETSEEGIESTFATNHVGHFLLTSLLLPTLRVGATAAAPSRVVVVGSASHYGCVCCCPVSSFLRCNRKEWVPQATCHRQAPTYRRAGVARESCQSTVLAVDHAQGVDGSVREL